MTTKQTYSDDECLSENPPDDSTALGAGSAELGSFVAYKGALEEGEQLAAKSMTINTRSTTTSTRTSDARS